MNSNQFKFRNQDRRRNTIVLSTSDKEFEEFCKAVDESEHQTRADWLRAAIEAYAGKKIFRDTCDQMNRK